MLELRDEVSIRMLGHFALSVNGESIERELGKSKKGLALLQLLILANGEPVQNQLLYDALWSGDKSTKPENALKTLVSRFRVILGGYSDVLSRSIETERGAYRFNTQLGISVDLYEAKRLTDKINGQTELTENDLPYCEALLALYGGDLLSDSNGSEAWAIDQQAQIHQQCFDLMYRYIDKLNELEKYNDSVYACRRLLEIDNFDERLQVTLMDTMLRRGNINEALSQHKHATEIYYKYLSMEPPKSIQDFYQKIINADKSLDESLGMICTEL